MISTHSQHLLPVDNQGWGKADLIAVRGLGQQPVFLQCQAKIPGRFFIGMRYHDGIEQAFSANGFDIGAIAARRALSRKQATHGFGIGGHVFILQHGQCGQRYLAGQWIAAIGGAMLAGANGKHNGVVGQHGAHRQQARR